MVKTASNMVPLGQPAPDFTLPDFNGKMYSLADFKDKPVLLIMFICNHCPYVKYVRAQLADLVQEYQAKGVAAVGINANDADAYPDDSPEAMREAAIEFNYTFPFLVDASQKTAKAYQAACTPDFYVYNQERNLVYRGQMDNSRPGNQLPVTGRDLRKALDAVLSGTEIPEPQQASLGCNIKWKRGNEPDYFK